VDFQRGLTCHREPVEEREEISSFRHLASCRHGYNTDNHTLEFVMQLLPDSIIIEEAHQAALHDFNQTGIGLLNNSHRESA
jgi:hypothetical protein